MAKDVFRRFIATAPLNADFRGRKIGDIFLAGSSISPVFFRVSSCALSLVFSLIPGGFGIAIS